MYKKILFFLTPLALLVWNCKTKSSLNTASIDNYRIGFYNVENLFDLVDDPKTKDEDFTPNGKQKWTAERYQKKLNQMTRVIEGMDFPIFLGMSEVENKTVLNDFCNQEKMKPFDYGIVHFDSPDFRGIDVGFIYQKAYFSVTQTNKIQINFPPDVVEDYTTRDILHIQGKLNNKTEFHFFVNHWPSRRGGLAASEPKRLFVAQTLNKAVNSILQSDPNANIIILGDFNDEPNNNSIARTLCDNENQLTNCFQDLDNQNEGSYNYRGNWNMLDQMLISPNLNNKKSKYQFQKAEIFKEDWMLYTDKKHGKRPNRTYGGTRYFGGFSDHLPVYIDLVSKK